MLNCCIERRRARESSVSGVVAMSVSKQNSQSDDDEFYECETDSAVTSPVTSSGRQCDAADGWSDAGVDTSLQFTDSLLYQADGRLKPCSDLQLLNVNERLYVPVTQEPAPMTEDMLEEHAEVLARYCICYCVVDHTYILVIVL